MVNIMLMCFSIVSVERDVNQQCLFSYHWLHCINLLFGNFCKMLSLFSSWHLQATCSKDSAINLCLQQNATGREKLWGAFWIVKVIGAS